MERQRRYRFKAKKSGLGWSTPLTWHAWVVCAAMFGAMAFRFATAADVGQKPLLGAWIPILVCLPIFWVFGEPLSSSRDRK